MLMDVESIRRQLDEEFLPLEPMITECRLIPMGGQEQGLAQCQQALGVTFPPHFLNLVSRFDFGRLTIGPIQFGYARDYSEQLLDENRDDVPYEFYRWWWGLKRPEGLLYVGGGDPYSILLDARSGRVYAYLPEHDPAVDKVAIADNFDLFFRGFATARLRRVPGGDNDDLARGVAIDAGVEPDNKFWRFMAM